MSRNEIRKRALTPNIQNSRLLITQNDTFSENEEDIDLEDECTEVASQLNLIRKRHDRVKNYNNQKKEQVAKLRKDLDKASEIVAASEKDYNQLNSRIEELQKQLEQTQQKHQEELRNKKTYLQMIDRIKKDNLALEVKSNGLKTHLKSAKNVLNQEIERSRKSKEAKAQSRVMVEQLRSQIMQDQRKKTERIIRLEKNIKIRQEAAQRREERQRRQAEIAKAAASLDKDSHEMKLREKLLAHRLWYTMLNNKLQREMAKAVNIESAFRKVKAATGLSDAHEIVERFLTREQTYSQLLETVQQSEVKLEELKQQNKKAREELQRLEFNEAGESKGLYQESEELQRQIETSQKEYLQQKEKLAKLVRMYDTILEWGLRTAEKVGINHDLQISSAMKEPGKNSLSDLFELLAQKVEDLVEPLQDNQEKVQQIIDEQEAKTVMEIKRDVKAKSSNFSEY